MIIALLNQKGGVGKTTLGVNLATCLAQDKNRVLLIDADSQATALDWDAARILPKIIRVVGMTEPVIHKRVRGIREKYAHAVIDAPAGLGSEASTAMAKSIIAAADMILIPVRPAAPDIWAAKEVVALIEEARTYKPAIKAAFVINCRQINTKLARETDIVLGQQALPTMQSTITHRTSIAWTFSRGYSVFDLKTNRKGAEEITALKNEIIEVMKQ